MDGLTSASSDPETRAMYKARLQELNDALGVDDINEIKKNLQ